MAKKKKLAKRPAGKRSARKRKSEPQPRYADPVTTAVAAPANRDIVIFDHPTVPGSFDTDPFRVVLVRAEGPHRVRFWNQTSEGSVMLRFARRLGGRERIQVNSGQHEVADVTPTHERGRIPYTIRAAALVEKESVPDPPPNAAADPQIIIE